MTPTDYDKVLFERANNGLKVQGIIGIVFGGLGTLLGLVLILLFLMGVQLDTTPTSAFEGFMLAVVTLVFLVIPHVYLIISGSLLVKQPQPSLARGLTVANVVIGALSNLIILVVAIISLTQSSDYERHFPKHKG